MFKIKPERDYPAIFTAYIIYFKIGLAFEVIVYTSFPVLWVALLFSYYFDLESFDLLTFSETSKVSLLSLFKRGYLNSWYLYIGVKFLKYWLYTFKST